MARYKNSMEHTPKRGRPRKSPSEKMKLIQLRMTPADEQVIDAAAILVGVSRSKFVRESALARAKRLLRKE